MLMRELESVIGAETSHPESQSNFEFSRNLVSQLEERPGLWPCVVNAIYVIGDINLNPSQSVQSSLNNRLQAPSQ